MLVFRQHRAHATAIPVPDKIPVQLALFNSGLYDFRQQNSSGKRTLSSRAARDYGLAAIENTVEKSV
jgi:hypothetical protein